MPPRPFFGTSGWKCRQPFCWPTGVDDSGNGHTPLVKRNDRKPWSWQVVCRLAVATGKSRRGLDEVLQTVQLKGVFNGSRTADETAGKPHPRMLRELMREFGTDPGRTLMIGDTTHDLQMAKNAGCASVGVSYGAHEPAEFDDLAPLHVAHSVRDLHEWLQQNA